MSLFNNLKTYSWNNCIDGKPFEIKVFARNPEEARREVFAIMAEIAKVKPHYEAVDKEIYRRYQEKEDKKMAKAPPPPVKKSWAQVTNGTSPTEKTIEQLRKERDALSEGIPADFFDGCFAATTFDYTADKVMCRFDHEAKTLGDFIRTIEPTCCGPVRVVSFRSCLDG